VGGGLIKKRRASARLELLLKALLKHTRVTLAAVAGFDAAMCT
jgi:hypothetical protein